MHSSTDQDYYRRRAAKARQLAEQATDPGVRLIHRQMLARYEALAAGDQIRLNRAGD
ncbi:hypothetical protein [Sphingomonas sp. LT1P40]|uniref:hypothetical protein n=1 Tax=Alteristakelama amylovorans TaxID=3096166 RepID=UPI002FC75AFF